MKWSTGIIRAPFSFKTKVGYVRDCLVMALSEFKQTGFLFFLAGLLIISSCNKKKFEDGKPGEYSPAQQTVAPSDISSQVEPQKEIEQKGLNEKGAIELL